MRFLLILLSICSLKIQAHPVIYKGGWVYDGFFMPSMNTQRIAYTVEPSTAIEVNSSYLINNNSYRDYAAGVNYLFKRWYGEQYQANIYGSLHAGYYKNNISEGLVSHTVLMGDWETRQIYTALKTKVFYFGDTSHFKYSYRIGMAPYIAGMDSLQSWLVLQLDYFKLNNRNLLITPLLRFFYKNVLWEIGANTKSQYFLNLMVHY